MRGVSVKLCVTVSKEITQAITDLLFELDELTDLIPEWNNYERDQIIEKIDITLGELLDLKRDENTKVD